MGPVPPNIFTRDLHKPSVSYASAAEEGPPIEPTVGPEAPSVTKTPAAKPKAMEIDTEPIWCPPAVHHHRGRPSPTLGLAHGSLRAPCYASNARRKRLPPGILLADGGG